MPDDWGDDSWSPSDDEEAASPWNRDQDEVEMAAAVANPELTALHASTNPAPQFGGLYEDEFYGVANPAVGRPGFEPDANFIQQQHTAVSLGLTPWRQSRGAEEAQARDEFEARPDLSPEVRRYIGTVPYRSSPGEAMRQQDESDWNYDVAYLDNWRHAQQDWNPLGNRFMGRAKNVAPTDFAADERFDPTPEPPMVTHPYTQERFVDPNHLARAPAPYPEMPGPSDFAERPADLKVAPQYAELDAALRRVARTIEPMSGNWGSQPQYPAEYRGFSDSPYYRGAYAPPGKPVNPEALGWDRGFEPVPGPGTIGISIQRSIPLGMSWAASMGYKPDSPQALAAISRDLVTTMAHEYAHSAAFEHGPFHGRVTQGLEDFAPRELQEGIFDALLAMRNRGDLDPWSREIRAGRYVR